MSKNILYILKFKNDANFFKIGITTNLLNRINQIDNAVENDIDFDNSLVYTSKKDSDIRLLEKNLLRITEPYKMEVFLRSKIIGKTEFREIGCLNIVLDFIALQVDYGVEFKKFESIDICGNYSHKIPKVYYPNNIRAQDSVSRILINDIQEYCNSNKLCIVDFYNDMLLKKAISLGIDRKNTPSNLKNNAYKV